MHGGVLVSWLEHLMSPDEAIWAGAFDCWRCATLEQDNTLTMPLSTQVYKREPVNAGGNPAMD